MRTRMINVLFVAFVLIPALLCSTCLAGCASNKGVVGTTYRQNNTEVTNAPPINMKVDTPTGAITGADGNPVLTNGAPTVPVESISTSGTGPAGLAVSNETESRAVFNNAVMRNIFMKYAGLTLNSSSGSDMTATADKIKFTEDSAEIVGFKFTTTASEPLRASNESLAALKEVFLKLSEDQRAVYIAQLETQKAAGGIAGEFAASVLKYLLAP